MTTPNEQNVAGGPSPGSNSGAENATNGFYTVYFTGVEVSGHAVFMLRDGVLVGADAAGGEYDGSYKENENGNYMVSLTVKMQAGMPLVTGAVSREGTLKQEINAAIPANFSNGRMVGIQTPMGPVNAIFRKLRNIP